MKLFVIHGPPATGKTTIAKKLLDYAPAATLITKDSFKEEFYKSKRDLNRIENQRLSDNARAMVHEKVTQAMAKGKMVIVEGNFVPGVDDLLFRREISQFNYSVIQIFCTAPKEIAKQRFLHRIEIGERMKGHDDFLDWRRARRYDKPLDIPGRLVVVSEQIDIHDPHFLEKTVGLW